jgi:hypothetical protein
MKKQRGRDRFRVVAELAREQVVPDLELSRNGIALNVGPQRCVGEAGPMSAHSEAVGKDGRGQITQVCAHHVDGT